ncbi:hypothetical protein PMAYCL1PPCAC_22661, partial [Pristionchus mayeri]
SYASFPRFAIVSLLKSQVSLLNCSTRGWLASRHIRHRPRNFCKQTIGWLIETAAFRTTRHMLA